MAITPIDIFQNPQGSIVGRMLAGGVQVFGDAISSAVNIGRDLANHQERSEVNFLAERRNEENLAQRRAENVVEQANRDRAFGESTRQFNLSFGRQVAEDERDFGYRKEEDARDNERLTAAQLFSQASTGMRLAQGEEENSLRRQEIDIRRKDAAAEREFNEKLVTPPPVEFGPQPPPGMKEDGGPVTPEEIFAQGRIIEESGRELRNPEAVQRGVRMQAQAKAAMGSGTDKESTLSREREERLRRSEERTVAREEQAARDKEAEALIADIEAFAPQLPQQEIDPATKDYKDPAAAQRAEMFDKDRFASEKAVATGVSREAYVKKGGDKLTESQQERRGKFWDLVNAKADTKTPAAAPETLSELQEEIERLKRPKS